MKMVGRVLTWISGAVLLVSVFLLFYLTVGVRSGAVSPTRAYIILSGSMAPELPVGSVVFVRELPFYTKGDVVTFSPDGKKDNTVTHRITSVSAGSVFFGDSTYTTKGDANDTDDNGSVSQKDVRGKVFLTVPYIGYAADFAKTPQGFVLLVIIPATIIIYEELKSVIRESLKAARKNRSSSPPGPDSPHSPVRMLGIVIVFLAAASLVATGARSFFHDRETTEGHVLGVALDYSVPTPTPAPVGFANGSFESDLSSWIAGKNAGELSAAVWLDASQESYADGDAVPLWTDRIGEYDFTQEDDGYKPEFKENVINGLPVMRFTSDRLRHTALSLGDHPFLMFVLKPESTVPEGIFDSAHEQVDALANYSSGYWHIWDGNPNSTFSFSGTSAHLLAVQASAGPEGRTLQNWVDGTASPQTSSGTTTSINWGGPTIGSWNTAARHYAGDMAEVVLFQSAPSDADRILLHSHLAFKYQVPLSGEGANGVRDTGTAQSGNASLKVTAKDDTDFYSYIHPGSSSVFTVTGYAYTDGSPVTSGDLSILYGGSVAGTTHEDAGAGWYKLTAVVTGVDEDVKAGVRVKEGTTVYLDNFGLTLGGSL